MNEETETKVTLRLTDDQIARLPDGGTNTERVRGALLEWFEGVEARKRTGGGAQVLSGTDAIAQAGAQMDRMEEILLEILTNGVVTAGSALRTEAAARMAAGLVEGDGSETNSGRYEAECERLLVEHYDQMARRADGIFDAAEAGLPPETSPLPVETAAE